MSKFKVFAKKNPQFMVFVTLALALVLIAIFAPLIAPHSPYEATLANAMQAPSAEHPFGTDRMGRDLLSRVIFGTRTSLSAALSLVAIVAVFGTLVGMLAGYFRGIIDAVIMRIADMMVAFPGMVLAIAVAGVLGASLLNAVVAIAIVTWPKYARLSRSLVLKLRSSDYISAAVVSGTKMPRILAKHVLPNILPMIVIIAATDIGTMMLEIAGLSFLGFGASGSTAEWGYMLSDGRAYLTAAPWLMIFPGAAIFITVMIFNMLGDSLRDVLDPRGATERKTKKKRGTKRLRHRMGVLTERKWFAMRKIATKFAAVGMTAVLLGAAVIMPGCSPGSSSSDGSDASHLNFGCYNYSNYMDPVTNVDSSWCFVRYGVGECLFRFNDEGDEVEYALCDSYETDDYITWTLHIRDGIQFSNGNEVSASAVLASLERLYEQEASGAGNSTPSQYITFESMSADDETNTITLVCDRVESNLPGILCYPYYAIVDASVADSEIIGTGPYRVTAIDENSTIDLEANEYYWDGDVPYDTITIYLIDDSSTKAMALKSGDVDLVENITTISDLEELSNDSDYYVSIVASMRTANSYFNYNGVLSNEALREAIQYAIDDTTMCEVTTGGMYTEGAGVIPSSLGYGADQLEDPYTYNLEMAEQVLDEAGIVDTDGDGIREIDGENINLIYNTTTSRYLNDFAEAISLSLESIGIGCTVNVQDYDTLLANQSTGNFDISSSNAITVPTGDPTGFLANWYSGNSDSYGYYSNDEYDALYEELLETVDEDAKIEIITEMQQILIDDAATIVHGYYNSSFASRADVVSGADILPIDYYWITTRIKPAA